MSDIRFAMTAIREARRRGWTPDPADLAEYQRTLDYEKPGDDEFLVRLGIDADCWLGDNR